MVKKNEINKPAEEKKPVNAPENDALKYIKDFECTTDNNVIIFIKTLMKKTTEETLNNAIQFHNTSLLKLLFEQCDIDQSLINNSFASSCKKTIVVQSQYSSFGCCYHNNSYDNRYILGIIAEYIDLIDDKSLNFIIDEYYYEVLYPFHHKV